MWLLDVARFSLNGFSNRFRGYAQDVDGLLRRGLVNHDINVPWPWSWTEKYVLGEVDAYLSKMCDDSFVETLSRKFVFFCDYGLFKVKECGINKHMNLPLYGKDLEKFKKYCENLHGKMR